MIELLLESIKAGSEAVVLGLKLYADWKTTGTQPTPEQMAQYTAALSAARDAQKDAETRLLNDLPNE